MFCPDVTLYSLAKIGESRVEKKFSLLIRLAHFLRSFTIKSPCMVMQLSYTTHPYLLESPLKVFSLARCFCLSFRSLTSGILLLPREWCLAEYFLTQKQMKFSYAVSGVKRIVCMDAFGYIGMHQVVLGC